MNWVLKEEFVSRIKQVPTSQRLDWKDISNAKEGKN